MKGPVFFSLCKGFRIYKCIYIYICPFKQANEPVTGVFANMNLPKLAVKMSFELSQIFFQVSHC